MSVGLTSKRDLPESIERVAHTVIGCAIEVHRHLGPGLLESLYEHALVHELGLAGANVQRQIEVRIPYKDIALPPYRVDLVVERCVIVELKAVESIQDVHKAQLLSYLRMTGLALGLVINFNESVLKTGIKRVINERSASFISSSSPSGLRVQPDRPC